MMCEAADAVCLMGSKGMGESSEREDREGRQVSSRPQLQYVDLVLKNKPTTDVNVHDYLNILSRISSDELLCPGSLLIHIYFSLPIVKGKVYTPDLAFITPTSSSMCTQQDSRGSVHYNRNLTFFFFSGHPLLRRSKLRDYCIPSA